MQRERKTETERENLPYITQLLISISVRTAYSAICLVVPDVYGFV